MSKDAIPEPDSALILVDFQYEFLDAAGRMPVARSHVEPTLDAARRAIDGFRAAGRPVVAIGNEFRRGDAVMNLLRRYASLEGSKGARWDERIPLTGLTYFPKWASSAFVNPEFEAWLKRERVKTLVLTGMFASACVTATAKDALKRGFGVRLLEEAIACSNDRSKARSLRRLERAGATLAA